MNTLHELGERLLALEARLGAEYGRVARIFGLDSTADLGDALESLSGEFSEAMNTIRALQEQVQTLDRAVLDLGVVTRGLVREVSADPPPDGEAVGYDAPVGPSPLRSALCDVLGIEWEAATDEVIIAHVEAMDTRSREWQARFTDFRFGVHDALGIPRSSNLQSEALMETLKAVKRDVLPDQFRQDLLEALGFMAQAAADQSILAAARNKTARSSELAEIATMTGLGDRTITGDTHDAVLRLVDLRATLGTLLGPDLSDEEVIAEVERLISAADREAGYRHAALEAALYLEHRPEPGTVLTPGPATHFDHTAIIGSLRRTVQESIRDHYQSAIDQGDLATSNARLRRVIDAAQGRFDNPDDD